MERVIKPVFEGKPGVRLIFPSSPVTSAETVKITFRWVVEGLVPGDLLDDVAYRAALCARGEKISSWVDDETIMNMPGSADVDIDVLTNAADYKAVTAYVHDMIRKQIKLGLPPERIFLAGHSQGGMVASLLAHTFPDAQLGGLILTSSIPWSRAIKHLMEPVQKKLPILGFNCCDDKVLASHVADERYAVLKDLGCDVEHHITTDHTLTAAGYHDVMTEQMQKPFLQFVFREAAAEAPKEEIKVAESPQEQVKPAEGSTEEAKPAEVSEQEAKAVESPTDEAKPPEALKEEATPAADSKGEPPADEAKPAEAPKEEAAPQEASKE
jgi:predicted esterase